MAPVDRVNGLVQSLRGVGEEGDRGGLDAEQPRHARLDAPVDCEHLLAPGHARALEPPEAPAGVVVRPEPRRLAAGGEVGDAVESDELCLSMRATPLSRDLSSPRPSLERDGLCTGVL